MNQKFQNILEDIAIGAIVLGFLSVLGFIAALIVKFIL